MKNCTISLYITFILSFFSIFTLAQTSPRTSSLSLDSQYQELLKRSWTQQGYKVVNPQRLSLLWKNVQDSLKIERRKYFPLQSELSNRDKTIAELKAKADSAQKVLEKSESSINQVELLGVPLEKSTYNTIMWGAVIILALALAVVLFTAGKSVREARYRRQLFDELSAEYQTFKVKANEKEKKLARELQTERNRVEELLDKNK